jgi:hypothetical protein
MAQDAPMEQDRGAGVKAIVVQGIFLVKCLFAFDDSSFV